MVKRFKYKVYTRQLFVWSCKVKNADLDKYGYSGYGIGFDSTSQFSLPNGDWGKNVGIFGVDSNSSVHTY